MVVAVTGALLAGCSAAPPSQSPSAVPTTTATPSAAPSAIARGGTVRIVAPTGSGDTGEYGGIDADNPAFLDPQLDLSRASRELIRCCLGRTLYSYNGRPVEEGGARLQPDLAVAMPEVSPDGLTWTIRIKPGLHYGPPLERVEITAADFVRGMHRLFAPALQAPAWYALQSIEGGADYASGTASSIAGVEAPDAHTLVLHLVQQEGDLAQILAEALSAPIPPDPFDESATLGIAEGADEGFGRFLVSSGPYMVEGSPALDFSVAASRRLGVSGLSMNKITLVRNPSWDPATDPLRAAYADRLEITIAPSMASAVAAVEAGSVDLLWNPRAGPPSVTPEVYAAFDSDPARGQVHVNSLAKVNVIALNVAMPPFDDLHVRKALNWALDKQRLVDLLGGPSAAQVARHIGPDFIEGGFLLDYDPYRTPGGHGDLDAARAEMKLSRYDTNKDGTCDARACSHLPAIAREQYGAVARSVAESYRPLGIDLDVQPLGHDEFQARIFGATAKVSLEIGLSWAFNLLTGAWTFDPWFHSEPDEALAGEALALPLVGATPEQLQRWGYGKVAVPNVDARLDACAQMVGTAQTQCWAAFDQYAMEQLAVLIPYSVDRFTAISSRRVVSYGFDELVGTAALDQLAVRP